jgi:hypothetical protein
MMKRIVLQSQCSPVTGRWREATFLRRILAVPPRTAETRAYLRHLRAAELAAWEMTGGDCLMSRFAEALNGKE